MCHPSSLNLNLRIWWTCTTWYTLRGTLLGYCHRVTVPHRGDPLSGLPASLHCLVPWYFGTWVTGRSCAAKKSRQRRRRQRNMRRWSKLMQGNLLGCLFGQEHILGALNIGKADLMTEKSASTRWTMIIGTFGLQWMIMHSCNKSCHPSGVGAI